MAAALVRIYESPNYSYAPGNVHIFRTDENNTLHGRLTVLSSSSGVRIVAEKAKHRDGVPINGDLIDVVEKVLKRQNTVGLATNSMEVIDHLRSVRESRFEGHYGHQSYIRDGRTYIILSI